MDLAKLSREDMIMGGLGLFLIVDLLFLPWYSSTVFGVTFTASATSSPYSIWGVLALLMAIAFLADLALDRFGGASLPAIGGSRATTRTALAGGTLAFMAIKFLAHTSDFGFGFWLGIVAAIALVVLCVRETAA
jgi:hypothetical protein